MSARLIKTLRRLTSRYTVSCRGSCSDCCHGQTLMTKREWSQINHPGKLAVNLHNGSCSFLEEGSCAIYGQRPIICRLYGVPGREEYVAWAAGSKKLNLAVNGEPMHVCFHGASAGVAVDYRDILFIEQQWLQAVIHDVGREMRALIACEGKEMPPDEKDKRFGYLSYILTLEAGQKLAARIIEAMKARLAAEREHAPCHISPS